MTPEETIDLLNELIQICKEGEEGYATAAGNIRNSELETMFRGYARKRADFVHQLQQEVERLGGKPSDSGGLGAAMRRRWLNLTSALSGSNPGAIIAACESGEDHTLVAYDRAANTTDVTGKTRALIDKQFQQVKETHIRLDRLKEEIKDGTRFPVNE